MCFLAGMLVGHAFSKNNVRAPRTVPRNMYTVWEDGKRLGQQLTHKEEAIMNMIKKSNSKMIQEMSISEKKTFRLMEIKLTNYINKNPGKRVSYHKLLDSEDEEMLYGKIKTIRIELKRSMSTEEKKTYRSMMTKLSKPQKMKLFSCII